MGRTPCCDKYNVKRGLWSPEEDATLKKYIEEHGIGGSWMSLPLKAGLKRCGKSCRLRWMNYLRPDIRREAFTEAENNIICTLYRSIGNRWSAIAAQLPGRTDNDVKNHWNTRLKKRLLSETGSSSTGANRTNTNSDTAGAVATNIRYPDSAQVSVFASNQTHHLDLVNSPCRNAIPSTLPLHSDLGRQYQQYYYPQGLILDQQSEFPLSSVPDASNAVGTSESNSHSKSSSQEITTLSSSPSLALDTNQYPSSCFGGGGVNNQPDDGLLLDYGLDSLSVTFDDLTGFQGTCCNVVPPHLGDPLFNY